MTIALSAKDEITRFRYRSDKMAKETSLDKKFRKLQNILKAKKRVLVAFSGGVDSSFLLASAKDILDENAEAAVVNSALFPAFELARALDFCRKYGINCTIVESDALEHDEVSSNSPDRCYHCKKLIFTALGYVAKQRAFEHIVDGSNADDARDYRPGKRALAEMGISSPLAEAGLTKDDIRKLSKKGGLETWSLPSAACLASRIPYGEKITEEKLLAIEDAESFLRSLGFSQVRVRHHGVLAKLEVLDEEWRKLDKMTRKKICSALNKIGFTFVALDLAGYRAGAMNEALLRR